MKIRFPINPLMIMATLKTKFFDNEKNIYLMIILGILLSFIFNSGPMLELGIYLFFISTGIILYKKIISKVLKRFPNSRYFICFFISAICLTVANGIYQYGWFTFLGLGNIQIGLYGIFFMSSIILIIIQVIIYFVEIIIYIIRIIKYIYTNYFE